MLADGPGAQRRSGQQHRRPGESLPVLRLRLQRCLRLRAVQHRARPAAASPCSRRPGTAAPSRTPTNPPSCSGSKKLRNYSRRAATGPAGVGGGGRRTSDTPTDPPSEHFQYSEPVISMVRDWERHSLLLFIVINAHGQICLL